MTYLVTAYRWGWVNAHRYIVYCGPDRTKAIAMADAEAADRGGKYGCQVADWDDDGIESRDIHYSPSTYGEDKPFHNNRLDMFSSLGHVLHSWAQGHAMVPGEGGVMRPLVNADPPPQWIMNEVKRKEDFAEAVARMKGAKGAEG